jgi:hypothetical protein
MPEPVFQLRPFARGDSIATLIWNSDHLPGISLLPIAPYPMTSKI